VGEKESEPFQFTFNGFLKVAFQGSRVTSDAGLILVRELDERLGLEAIIAAHLRDSRYGLNTQFRLPDLLRQSVYSRLAGSNKNVEWEIADVLFRPVGRPSRKPLVRYKKFPLPGRQLDHGRRVVAKVEHHVGERFPRTRKVLRV